jgi:membrane associated rhomboid family serine protease
MYALWAFGTPLEQMWGKKKFLFYYLSVGVGAALIYTLVNYIQFNSFYENLIALGITQSELSQILEIRTQVYDGYFLELCEEILKKNPSLTPESINPNLLVEINRFYHTPAVGASGAVYGILVAFGMSFPNAKLGLIFIPVPIAAKYFIPGIILIDLFSGITGFSIFGSNIAHFAHVGGALVGFLIFNYWKKNPFKRWD